MDKLVLLLSTDWFFEHWNTIDLRVDTTSRSEFQSGCQKIAMQIISGAREYYHASFSDQRIHETRVMLNELVNRSRLDDDVAKRINRLVDWSQDTGAGNRNLEWVLLMLTRRISTENSGGHDSALSANILSAVARAQEEYDVTTIDFQQLSLQSQSQWDRFTRELTPGLPTFLADYLSEKLLVKINFERIWVDLSKALGPEERSQLQSWYRRAAETWMGLDTHQWPAPWGSQN